MDVLSSRLVVGYFSEARCGKGRGWKTKFSRIVEEKEIVRTFTQAGLQLTGEVNIRGPAKSSHRVGCFYCAYSMTERKPSPTAHNSGYFRAIFSRSCGPLSNLLGWYFDWWLRIPDKANCLRVAVSLVYVVHISSAELVAIRLVAEKQANYRDQPHNLPCLTIFIIPNTYNAQRPSNQTQFVCLLGSRRVYDTICFFRCHFGQCN